MRHRAGTSPARRRVAVGPLTQAGGAEPGADSTPIRSVRPSPRPTRCLSYARLRERFHPGGRIVRRRIRSIVHNLGGPGGRHAADRTTIPFDARGGRDGSIFSLGCEPRRAAPSGGLDRARRFRARGEGRGLGAPLGPGRVTTGVRRERHGSPCEGGPARVERVSSRTSLALRHDAFSLLPTEETLARADDWTTQRVPARADPRGTTPFDPLRLHRMAG